MRSALALVAAICAQPLTLAAQRATLSGRVLTDSTRVPVANAAVAIPSLNRSTSTDEQGRFELRDLRTGSHEIVVRRLGYSPYNERIALKVDQSHEHEILLVRATVLDSITVSASSVIPSFEENRALGLGKFFTRADLAKQEGRRVSEVIAQLPGVRVIPGRSNFAWLATRRGSKSLNPRTCGVDGGRGNFPSGRGLDLQDANNGAKQCECYALVYVDKALVYRGSMSPGEPLFNLNSINVDQIEAIEYYASAAQTPMEYSRLNSQCGVLVIHTRKTY